MTLEISQRKLELALEEYEDAHDEPLSVRTKYSGRYMYGRNCLGVVGQTGDLLRFVLEIVPALKSEYDGNYGDQPSATYHDEWFEVRSDSMGMDTIFYWPEVEVVRDEPDDVHPADAKFDSALDLPND